MGSETWDGYLDSNWNNTGNSSGSNWNPAPLPPDALSTAFFPDNNYFHYNITFSQSTTGIGQIVFGSILPYTFTLFGQTLNIGGLGISTGNAAKPTFNLSAQSFMKFNNGGTAANVNISCNGLSEVDFNNKSTASNSYITLDSGSNVYFSNSTAGNATININSYHSGITFYNGSDAGTAKLSVSSFASQGNATSVVSFSDTSNAASSQITLNGGSAYFYDSSSLANATLSIGPGGKAIFNASSSSGVGSISNSGTLDLSNHNPGDFTINLSLDIGLMFLGNGVQLDPVIGPSAPAHSLAGTDLASGNGANAAAAAFTDNFSGVISGGGGITMHVQGGTLTLSAANTYTGDTVITAGSVELAQGGSIAGNFVFQSSSATLKLDASNQIGGTINGFVKGDNIDIAFHTFAAGDHFVWSQNAANTAGTLSLLNGTGGVITTLNLSGVHTSSEFGVASDGSGGTVFTDTVIISTTTIQNDYLAITRTALPLDQATTVANAINSGTQTETQYVNGLLSQMANTTIPAVAVEASMYGLTGTSAEVTSLTTNFLPAQVANATANGLNPLVYACEALGLVFAFGNENSSTAFSNNFGPSNSSMPNTTAGDAAFAAAASSTIFGSASTPNLVNVMGGFVSFWKGFFTANGVPGYATATTAQIDLAARGASWGDMVGVALANNLGPLQGQAMNFLDDAAQGSAVYAASLVGQPAHQPFQGG